MCRPKAIFCSPMTFKIAQLGGKPPNLATLIESPDATTLGATPTVLWLVGENEG